MAPRSVRRRAPTPDARPAPEAIEARREQRPASAVDPTLVAPSGQLSGVLWPLRVAPAPDELLTSWIGRMAARHGVTPRALIAAATTAPLVAGGKAPHGLFDVDRTPPESLLDTLAMRTGTSRATVTGTLLAYPHLGDTLTDWLLTLTDEWLGPPLAVNRRWPERRTAVFCPTCLTEDADPYIRRPWRLGCVTVCLQHATALVDACAACGAPLVLPGLGSRHADGRSAIMVCERCGADRRDTPQTPAAARDVDAHVSIHAAVAGTPVHLAGLGTLTPADYLTALNTVVQLTTAGLAGEHLQPLLSHAAALTPVPPAWGTLHVKRPNHLTVADRRHVVTLAVWVLADWPRSFAEALLTLDLWRSDHIWRPNPAPLWAAIRTYYDMHHLAACPPSFRPRRPYTSPWEL